MENSGSYWLKVFNWLFFPKGINDRQRLSVAVRDKVILITGASYGIGEATAYRLSSAGAIVILTGRTEDKLTQTADKIRASGGRAYVHVCDLSRPEQVTALYKYIRQEFNAVDIIVNNAGKSIRRSLALSYGRPQDFERTIAINYLGPVQLLLHCLPMMIEKNSGQVINVSAVGVRLAPAPRWAAYHSSKTAFDIWLRSAEPELRLKNIKITSIYLPLVKTRMSAPTPHYQKIPAMSADEAASLICRALIKKPKRIAPWWLGWGEFISVIFWRPIAWSMSKLFLYTQDSPAASKAKNNSDQHE